MGANAETRSTRYAHFYFWIESNCNFSNESWPERSKPPESRPEEKLPESSLRPRLRENRPHQLEASRSPTDTDQEPSLSEKSDDTRNPLSFSSESSHSSDLSEK